MDKLPFHVRCLIWQWYIVHRRLHAVHDELKREYELRKEILDVLAEGVDGHHLHRGNVDDCIRDTNELMVFHNCFLPSLASIDSVASCIQDWPVLLRSKVARIMLWHHHMCMNDNEVRAYCELSTFIQNHGQHARISRSPQPHRDQHWSSSWRLRSRTY